MIGRPQNIFDVINQNIVTLSEDLHTLMAQQNELLNKVQQLENIFKAPEQPNARGEEGAESVSSEQ